MKSVVIVFPDRRFVENDPEPRKGNPLRLDIFERYWTETCPIISPREFRRRMCLMGKLIGQYRQRGYSVKFVTFSKESNPTEADSENIHYLYGLKKEDRIVSAGISYMQHTRESRYPDAKKVLEQIELGEEAVFGGFHKDDCVLRFADAANSYTIANVDEMLTEQGIYALLHTFEQDLHEYLIVRGSEIREDDDTTPMENKMFLLDKRLTPEDLKIRD